MIFDGALGVPGALDFEGRKWEPFFTGDFTEAKALMARLDAQEIPNRLKVPAELPAFQVVVEVMHRWFPEARKVLHNKP
jgi:hypothetical protein